MAKKQPCDNLGFEKSPHFLWQSRSTLSNEIDLVLQFVYIQRTNKKTTHELFAHESLIKYLVEPTHLLTEAVLKTSFVCLCILLKTLDVIGFFAVCSARCEKGFSQFSRKFPWLGSRCLI